MSLTLTTQATGWGKWGTDGYGNGQLDQFCNFPAQDPRARDYTELAEPLDHSVESKRS